LRVAACPDQFRAEALAEAIGDVAGCKILLARAEQAREILPETLRHKGADVDVLAVYRTVLPDPAPDPRCLEGADIFTFTSAGTVSNFLTLSGDLGRKAMEAAVVAAIGPITAARLAETGTNADLVAQQYTIPGLVEALVEHVAVSRS
jgi:uroporphyrinogen III methyltransferase/synthase